MGANFYSDQEINGCMSTVRGGGTVWSQSGHCFTGGDDVPEVFWCLVDS